MNIAVSCAEFKFSHTICRRIYLYYFTNFYKYHVTDTCYPICSNELSPAAIYVATQFATNTNHTNTNGYIHLTISNRGNR